MPINIPSSLPAASQLELENIFVMTEKRATQQDIRPLKILLLNLMPVKDKTETQILRLLSNSPLQVQIKLLQTASHISKNTPREHMIQFYNKFDDIKEEFFDGMIITGAPVERMEFKDVDYWEELKNILKWAKSHVFSVFSICWGAIAALNLYYDIPRHVSENKIFGIYPHTVLMKNHPLVKGFDETFYVPHSRYFYIDPSDIKKQKDLQILTSSDISGIHIISDKKSRNFFITGHSEYDRETLSSEYFRDKNKGLDIDIPYGYFPNDDTSKLPNCNWCCHANLLFSNWLNYIVYQNTPFDLSKLKQI